MSNVFISPYVTIMVYFNKASSFRNDQRGFDFNSELIIIYWTLSYGIWFFPLNGTLSIARTKICAQRARAQKILRARGLRARKMSARCARAFVFFFARVAPLHFFRIFYWLLQKFDSMFLFFRFILICEWFPNSFLFSVVNHVILHCIFDFPQFYSIFGTLYWNFHFGTSDILKKKQQQKNR